VERKFVPAADFCQRIENLGQSLGYNSHDQVQQPAHVSKFRDIYYDWNDHLSRSGIWIRHRITGPMGTWSSISDRWEAKLRLGGDYVNSEVVEISGKDTICEMLSERLPNITFGSLTVLADLETVRSEWTLIPVHSVDSHNNGRFSVVLDDVVASEEQASGERRTGRFQHRIGEVEIVRSLATAADSATAQELGYMRARVEGFLQSNATLCMDAEPVGKLSAYLAWRNGHDA